MICINVLLMAKWLYGRGYHVTVQGNKKENVFSAEPDSMSSFFITLFLHFVVDRSRETKLIQIPYVNLMKKKKYDDRIRNSNQLKSENSIYKMEKPMVWNNLNRENTFFVTLLFVGKLLKKAAGSISIIQRDCFCSSARIRAVGTSH